MQEVGSSAGKLFATGEFKSLVNSDPFDLQRFLDSQRTCYASVTRELAEGCKRTHWMWFIFPQIAGLGTSEKANHFAIKSVDEARAYLSHPVLGTRLRSCVQLVGRLSDRTAREIFGAPDDLKFRSCLTLFAEVSEPDSLFARVLASYFTGPDIRTQALLLASGADSGGRSES